jgi:hypothetical protein
MEQVQRIEYNPAIEALIKSLGEKALSLSWLHSRSEKRYSYLNNYLAIPSIVLSTVTATLGGTFAGDKTISYVTSIISIIVSIFTTLNSFFVFAKRAEAHRITSISYSKLYLQINIELSLPRQKRTNVKDFLKSVSEQIQRLNEIQPLVPDIVIKAYNEKFKDEPNTISKPEITNGLVDIKVFVDEVVQPTSVIEPIVVEPLVKETKKPAFR